MEDDILKFTKYINDNYDTNNKLIKSKYVHTLSVVSLSLQIAKMMNLDKDDIKLAIYIALFHDLGRFKEVIRQNTFNNLKFDHGAYSNKILFNDGFINKFNINEKDYLLIRKAIYWHNKKDISVNSDNRELFFSNLIRDVDRIDIIRVIKDEYPNTLFFDKPSNIILLNYLQGIPMNIKDLKTKADRILLRLNFIKQFKFHESFELLNESGYLDDFLDKVLVSDESSELFAFIKKDINKYINEYIKGDEKNVRQKVQSFRSRRK